MRTEWIRRSAKTRAAALAAPPAPPQDIDHASPLDIVNWLMKRYCAAIEAEDRKGEAADEKRIDQALHAAAALARSAAPYYHRRMKPGDTAPGAVACKHELIVSWTPPKHYNDNTPKSALAEEERPREAQATE
jgi:hypothetical protein